jgi:hypothetical protein
MLLEDELIDTLVEELLLDAEEDELGSAGFSSVEEEVLLGGGGQPQLFFGSLTTGLL